jgi:hypothetical protein
MNVEIGAEATLFPKKEYISGIFVAVYFIEQNCTCQLEERISYLPSSQAFEN